MLLCNNISRDCLSKIGNIQRVSVEEQRSFNMYHSLFILLFFTLTTSVNITTDINVEMTALPNVTVLVENFRNNWPIQDWIETGYFSEEYINDINIHWLQYPAPKAVNYYILGTLYFIIMVIGVFGNILVIYLFFR